MIDFGEWLPDQSDLANAGVLEAKNVVPAARGYRPFNSLSEVSGAADGYINTYKMALQEGLDSDIAEELALGAAWRQGTWYAVTSVFVPVEVVVV